MGKKTREHWLELDPRIFITERELAARWRHSLRSLQRWRAAGTGPRFIRVGRRVIYRLSAVEAFEAAGEADPEE
jgi:hypothetical protein